jgi:hypothetical protein
MSQVAPKRILHYPINIIITSRRDGPVRISLHISTQSYICRFLEFAKPYEGLEIFFTNFEKVQNFESQIILKKFKILKIRDYPSYYINTLS